MKFAILALSLTALAANASQGPAKDALDELRKKTPENVLQWMKDQDAKVERKSGVPHILVAGDSWADVVGAGGSLGLSFLMRRLKAHGCKATSSCIAIPGSTSDDWAGNTMLNGLKLAAKGADYVYVMLGGNDCLAQMPDCAHTGKSPDECGLALQARATANMEKIVDAVHEVNPNAKVVGFGYDTMFGGWGCGLITHDILPQCWKHGASEKDGNRCFNEQFLRIQSVFDGLAANRSFVDQATILGATQVAVGDTAASTDPTNRHIDMEAMGPAKYWPNNLECFHPSVANCGSNVTDCGATVVMEEFYKSYWSKQSSVCPSSSETVVV